MVQAGARDLADSVQDAARDIKASTQEGAQKLSDRVQQTAGSAQEGAKDVLGRVSDAITNTTQASYCAPGRHVTCYMLVTVHQGDMLHVTCYMLVTVHQGDMQRGYATCNKGQGARGRNNRGTELFCPAQSTPCMLVCLCDKLARESVSNAFAVPSVQKPV